MAQSVSDHVTGYDHPLFESRQGKGFFSSPKYPDRPCDPPSFLFSRYSSPVPRLKRAERDAEHSSSSSVEVRNEWSYGK